METDVVVRKKTGRKALIIILIFSILLLIAMFGAGMYFYQILDRDTIYEGVQINGIRLDGLTREQALERVTASNQAKLDTIHLELSHGEKKWPLGYQDMDIRFNSEALVDKAYEIGRKGSYIDRLKEIYQVKDEGISYETVYTYDLSPLKPKVKGIAEELSVQPVDATVKFKPDAGQMFSFTEEKAGRAVDTEKIMALLEEKMEKKDFSTIDIPVTELEPKVKAETLKKSTHKIASFTTTMTSNPARNQNIRLASTSFHGTVVAPGEVFSINDSTGPRTKARGYKDAPAIKNGKELVDEPGGGVCQVSSTLFNTVLLSDLEIVERWHHSWPSTYVPIGRDATINYGGADFKFKNNRETPIYLVRRINGLRLTVEIYGEPISDGMTVQVTSTQTDTIAPPAPSIINDPKLPSGTKEEVIKARNGYKSKTYKVYYKDGKKVKTELVASDYYKPVKGQYRVGTGAPAPTQGSAVPNAKPQ